MRNILLKLFIFVFLFCISGVVLAYSDNVNVNNLSNSVILTEYKCRILESDCTVDRIKYVQTGAVFYDAECNASHMKKSSYENNVINDIKYGYLKYCSMTERTLKIAE